MKDKLEQIFDKHHKGYAVYNKDEIIKELLVLFSVSVSFNEGYEKGWSEATSEACKEIAKNYQPNER